MWAERALKPEQVGGLTDYESWFVGRGCNAQAGFIPVTPVLDRVQSRRDLGIS